MTLRSYFLFTSLWFAFGAFLFGSQINYIIILKFIYIYPSYIILFSIFLITYAPFIYKLLMHGRINILLLFFLVLIVISFSHIIVFDNDLAARFMFNTLGMLLIAHVMQAKAPNLNTSSVSRFLNIYFLMNFLAAAVQFLFGGVHGNRATGLVEDPNGFGFLAIFFMIYFKICNKDLYTVMAFLLVIISGSSTALLGLVTTIFLSVDKSKKIMISLVLFCCTVLGFSINAFDFYEIDALYKIFGAFGFLINSSLSDIQELASFQNLGQISEVHGENLSSPLNRIAQYLKFFLLMDISGFIFGFDSPNFYESYLAFGINCIGVTALIITIWFYQKIWRIRIRSTRLLMLVTFTCHVVLTPVFSMPLTTLGIYLVLTSMKLIYERRSNENGY